MDFLLRKKMLTEPLYVGADILRFWYHRGGYCGALNAPCRRDVATTTVERREGSYVVPDCQQCPANHWMSVRSDGLLGAVLNGAPAWMREAILRASNARRGRNWGVSRALQVILRAARENRKEDPELADRVAAFFTHASEQGALYHAVMRCWLALHHQEKATTFFQSYLESDHCWRLMEQALLPGQPSQEAPGTAPMAANE